METPNNRPSPLRLIQQACNTIRDNAEHWVGQQRVSEFLAQAEAIMSWTRQAIEVRRCLLDSLNRLEQAAKVVSDKAHAGVNWEQMPEDYSELYNARNEAHAVLVKVGRNERPLRLLPKRTAEDSPFKDWDLVPQEGSSDYRPEAYTLWPYNALIKGLPHEAADLIQAAPKLLQGCKVALADAQHFGTICDDNQELLEEFIAEAEPPQPQERETDGSQTH